MGGILFMITVVITLVVLGQFSGVTWFVVGSAFLFGGIGLADDAIKIVMHHNEGLTPKQKIVLQFVAADPHHFLGIAPRYERQRFLDPAV